MTKIADVAEGESSTVDLYVRANIFDVFEIDFTANVFVFKGYLEVCWGMEDVHNSGWDEATKTPAWNPGIYFPDIIRKEVDREWFCKDPSYDKSFGKPMVCYRLIALFRCFAYGDLRDFPFDAHVVYFRVRSKAAEDRNTDWKVVIQQNPHFPSVGPDKKRLTMASIWNFVEMEPSGRRFSSSSSPYSKTGKMLVEVVTGTDTREDLNQKCAHVPAAAICFCIDRRSDSYVFNYIVPGAMIIMCSLFAFLLPICNIQNRMFLTITVMLTFLALRQIIRFSLPELSYLTQLDYYLLMGETIVFLVMVQSAVMYGVLLSPSAISLR
jgi:hypothetical protein